MRSLIGLAILMAVAATPAQATITGVTINGSTINAGGVVTLTTTEPQYEQQSIGMIRAWLDEQPGRGA
jgi:hypothetical protein